MTASSLQWQHWAVYIKTLWFVEAKKLIFPPNEEFTCNAGKLGLIPGLGRSPGEGNGYPLQCSCLGNPMEEPGRVKSLGLQRVGHNWAINTYRKILSIPGLDKQWWKLIEPGGVEMVIGLVKCRLLPWWRAWQPTPMLLPGEFQIPGEFGMRSLVSYSTWWG